MLRNTKTTFTKKENVHFEHISCYCLPNANVACNLPSLHASMPSLQVCSKRESPSPPHFLNQDAPRKQQLCLPALFATHFGHAEEAAGALSFAAYRYETKICKELKRNFRPNIIRLTCAGLDALVPSKLNFCVDFFAAFSYPTPTASATREIAVFARTTFGAHFWVSGTG